MKGEDVGMVYDKEKWESIIKRGNLARKHIVDHINRTGVYSGIIGCPNCSGKLSYYKARMNGHISADLAGRVYVW